jgi:hypothetical protein
VKNKGKNAIVPGHLVWPPSKQTQVHFSPCARLDAHVSAMHYCAALRGSLG